MITFGNFKIKSENMKIVINLIFIIYLQPTESQIR